MEKTIIIGETPVRFKASAATVRRYRETFQRDLLKDMTAVIEAAGNNQMTGAELETFENFAYLCAKAADPESVPASPDEWLDNFEMINIYEILPQLVDLWITGQKTLETPKKKTRPTERKLTAALFLLRCYELGLTGADLEDLSIGTVLDMFTEKSNDDFNYKELATQADFDRF